MVLSGQGSGTAIRAEDISRTYHEGETRVVALGTFSFSVEAGECVAVCGPSGSGKTTLLNLVAGLDRPDQGSISLFGERIDRLSNAQQAAVRARSIGLVFQDPHLFPGLTALENVTLARLPWERGRVIEKRARELLDAVGLAGRIDHSPARLSGGERQRVGIARALVGNPRLLLADEPTGNLDQATTRGILELLQSIQQARDLTMLIVSHDDQVAAIASRIIAIDQNAKPATEDGGTPA